MVRMALALASVFMAAPGGATTAPVQEVDTPHFRLDTSGIDLFWATADRLAAGELLDDADWEDFFSHPGYAVTEVAAQRKGVIRHCMTAAFSPEGDIEAAKANLPEGEGRRALVGRVCDHMVSIRDRRADIDAYVAELDGEELLREAQLRASGYLPEGILGEVDPPSAYVLLFEQQGLGREEAIVLDALAMMTMGREQNIDFIAHELHHAYRAAVPAIEPVPGAEPLFHALDRIVKEGIASMVDKAEYIRTDRTPVGFPPEFLQLASAAPERLAAIDQALAGVQRSPEGYAAASRVVSENSPWGGHLNGVYMAMAIESALGRQAIVDSLRSPAAFFAAYHRAAERSGSGYFRFSDEALENIVLLQQP